jgi:LuxR family transcriptional regulator, quorum-sensing system regulator BjaR1
MSGSAHTQKCLNFISDANEKLSEAELVNLYEQLLQNFGFHSYLMTELPLVPSMGPTDLFIRNNWSKQWWDRYINRRYYLVDPISIASFTESKPFYWSEAAEKYAKTKDAFLFMEEAAKEGLKEGLTFSFSDGLRWRSVVSIGKDHEGRLDSQDVGLLYLTSIQFGLALSTHKTEIVNESLSVREREILLWIACGKTAWEIGQILQIKKTTVDKHLQSTRTKLGAATNAHAVSLAITRGQLRP